jgi:hypothetical protein
MREGDWATAKGSSEKGLQVKCLISSEGHLWMRNYFDRLPAAVRKRLATSRFNLCVACITIEAEQIARRRGLKPSDKIYVETIETIEREMDRANKERS